MDRREDTEETEAAFEQTSSESCADEPWSHRGRLSRILGYRLSRALPILRIAFRADASCEPVRSKTSHRKIPVVVRFTAALIANSFGAIVLLGTNGYGRDAVRIARGMFEAAVNARYLQLNPAEVDDYLDFYWIRKGAIHEYFRKYSPSSLETLPGDVVAEMLSEIALVKPRFTDRRGKVRTSWSKTNLRARADAVGLGEYYPTFYANVSDLHHGNIHALLMTKSATEALQVDFAPSSDSVGTAFGMGHLAVLHVLATLNDVAELGMDRQLGDAGKAYNEVWNLKNREVS